MEHITPDFFAVKGRKQMPIDKAVSRRVYANEIRSTGPTWNAWPASLPQVSYVLADGGFLCVTCANGGNGSDASTENDDKQWRIIGAQVNDEATNCDHCGRQIISELAEFIDQQQTAAGE